MNKLVKEFFNIGFNIYKESLYMYLILIKLIKLLIIKMSLKNLFKHLPSYPHYKMNVFSGTNKFERKKNVLNFKLENNQYYTTI